MATYPLWSTIRFTNGVTVGKDLDGRIVIDPATPYPLTGRLSLRLIGLLLGARFPKLWQPHYYDGVTVGMDIDGPKLTDPALTERQRPTLRRGGGAPFALGLIRPMMATPRYFSGTLGKDKDGTLQPDPLSGSYRNGTLSRCVSGFLSFVTTHMKLPGLFKTIPDHRLTDPKQES